MLDISKEVLYFIHSKLYPNRVVSVSSRGSKNGSKISLFKKSKVVNTAINKFAFTKGLFASYSHPGKVINYLPNTIEGQEIYLHDLMEDFCQNQKFLYDGDFIIHQQTGQVLQVKGLEKENTLYLCLSHKRDETDLSQKWKLVSTKHSFLTEHFGQNINVVSKFIKEKRENVQTTVSNVTEVFKKKIVIKNMISQKVLTVVENRVGLAPNYFGPNQMWFFEEKKGKGMFKSILNLDIVLNFDKENNNINVTTCTKENNQKWEIKDKRIINQFNEKVLDIDVNQNLFLNQSNEQIIGQQWVIEKVKTKK